MIELYYTNALGLEPYGECIGKYGTIKECNKAMEESLKSSGFKSYYKRCWEGDEGIYIDYGSYTRYFLLKGVTIGEMINEAK